MKRVIAILVVALAWSALAVPARADYVSADARKVIDKVRKGVVSVQSVSIDSPIAAGNAGGGSGFVFQVDYDKREAYALTNAHVSGGSFVNKVHFWDNATYKAELVGLEPGIDVAVLRILDIPDERDLPDSEKTIIPCVLGDSDLVQIGEYSVAMGSPGISDAIGTDRDDPWGGLLAKQTATDGSVLGRDSPIEFGIGIWAQQRRGDLGPQYGTNFDFAFRVATPINPGNSGGPLFNERGEVIGINFYGGSFMIMQNFNHSIPINLAKDFATQILSTGKFIKPWLGLDIIMPQTIGSAEQYDEFKQLHAPDEITVFGVRKRSPAEQAGFEGDVIAMVDGIEFPTAEDLRLYVFKQPVGKMLEVTVKRNGRKLAEPIMVEVGPKRRFDAEFSV